MIEKLLKGVKSLLTPWNKSEHNFKATNGEKHRIFVDVKNKKPTLKVASDPTTILEFLAFWEKQPNLSTKKKNSIKDARNHYNTKVKPFIDKIEASEKKNEPESAREGFLKDLLKQNMILSMHLKDVIGSKTSLKDVKERYALEGTVGRYNSMSGGKFDKLEADHQPQNSALKYAAKKPCFKAPAVNLRKRARGSKTAALGYAINLHEIRHNKGRTYGRSPASSFTSAVDNISNSSSDDATKRSLIVEELKKELKLDVDAMNQVVGNPLNHAAWADLKEPLLGLSPADQVTFHAEMQKRIKAGEKQIANQPMDNLKD